MESIDRISNKEVFNRRFNIVVEGNIGCGKSTLLNYFKGSNDIEVVPEPVEKWCNIGGTNLLDLMYRDPEKWMFSFQSYAMLTFLQSECDVSEKMIRMSERSVHSAKHVFMEAAKMDLVHKRILNVWYDYVNENCSVGIDLIIYLRTSPNVSFRRIVERGRIEEKNIDLKYLETLHSLHDEWLMNNSLTKVLVLDLDQKSIINEYESIRKEIQNL